MNIFLKLLFLVIALVFFIYVFFYSADVLLSPASPATMPEACFDLSAGKKCFFVELAKTQAEREKGLMFRSRLDTDKGMLFIFNGEGTYPFWMKNTLIPLDIIWIDKNYKVAYVAESAQPCLPAEAGKQEACPLIIPPANSNYVLEINAGISKKIGLKPGDEFIFNP